MDWRAAKQEARDIVHSTMGYPCIYAEVGGLTISCTVRHHRKTAFIGNEEDFGPGLLSELNRVLIDLREVPSPKRNATLTFDDGLVLKIETTTPQGENYVMCEVK